MGLRNKVEASLKQAMRDKDTARLSTLRLINAAIKDMEIARRGAEEPSRSQWVTTRCAAILGAHGQAAPRKRARL